MSDAITLPAGKKSERIEKALSIIVAYGGIDGADHKDWVLDQVARALTGCPVITQTRTPKGGQSYEYQCQGESQDYKDLVAQACDGEDGPQTYTWETGIAPEIA